MGIFEGFAEGLASAVDNIRNEFETAVYGRPTTDAIELPQAEAPVIEAPSTGAAQEGMGVSSAEIWNNEPVQYSDHDEIWDARAPEPSTSWAELSSAMQDSGIEAPQMDTPEVSAPSVEIGGDD